MITGAGRQATLRGLSGDVGLLSGAAEIRDAGRVPADLSRMVSLEFGPAGKDWQVTGFAVYRQQRKLLQEPLSPVDVLAGQSLVLKIAAKVTDD